MRIEIVNFHEDSINGGWIAHFRFEEKHSSLEFDDFEMRVSSKEQDLINFLMSNYEDGCFVEMLDIVHRLKNDVLSEQTAVKKE